MLFLRAVFTSFLAEASSAGVLWNLCASPVLSEDREEDSTEVRKVCPGEVYFQGSDELVGAEEGALSQGCLRNGKLRHSCAV